MTTDTDWQLVRNRFHTYGNPISVAKMERVFDLLDLPQGARALDVGCGKGELLIRLVERSGVTAVGIDPSPVLQMARESAAARVPDADLTWHDAKCEDVELEPASFDLTACIGAHHAFGTLGDMLSALHDLTRPGGFVLVGDGFWAEEPTPEYFRALGVSAFEQNDHVGNIQAAIACGLRPLYSTISSRDEWDEFEWLYRYAMEQHRHEHGFSPEQEEQLGFRHRFLMAQLRWGRDMMGFALYLFRRPHAPPES